jgi:peptide/nickel transport system substrate-binding protein
VRVLRAPFVTLAALACLAALTNATAPSRTAQEAARGGRVVIGVRGDVTSFNIYTATNAFSQEVIDLLYLKLADEQDDFSQGPPSFRPALASTWEMSPDRTRLTFHLDEEARWSDGHPVTSADVLFSHRAARSPEVAWVGSDVKEHIAEATAPDPHTVVFKFSRAYPYQLMDAVEGNILPAHLFETIPFADWPKRPFLEAPVSSGPFLLKRYERGAVIELTRNPSYRRAPLPRLDSVIFRIIPDETTLLNELLTGGIDVMENVPPEAVARLEASRVLRIVRVPDLSYTFVCWNTSRPLFSDARVRRALTLAIDREAIIEGLLHGTGRPSLGPVLSFLWAHDTTLRPLDYDPGAARRLLRSAGWEDRDKDGILQRDGVPFRFTLETNQGSALRSDIVQMISAQLRQVGVEATPRILEFGTFIERHEKHDFDAFVGSWRESTKVDLKSAFHSSGRNGGYNYGLYADAELDDVIDRARIATDARVALKLWRRAQQIVARDQPYTFLFERDRLHALPRRLSGFHPSPRSIYVGLEEWAWEPSPKEGR